MKTLRSTILALAVTLNFAGAALATCASGTLACGAACNTACTVSGSFTYTGMCVAGAGGATCSSFAVSPASSYVRCGAGAVNGGGAAGTCAGAPFGITGCSSDNQCGTNQICVSATGTSSGCGTGGAVCMTACSG